MHKRGGKKRKRTDDKKQESDSEEDYEESDYAPGISYWIAYDWPECGASAFEEMIAKMFFTAGLDLESCRTVKGRGIQKRLLLYSKIHSSLKNDVKIFFLLASL